MIFATFALAGLCFLAGLSGIGCRDHHRGTPQKQWVSQFRDTATVTVENRTDLSGSGPEDHGQERTSSSSSFSSSTSQWFLEVPLLPFVFAKSNSIPDGPCKRQVRRYLRDLQNGTLWAVQMFDASTKYPEGLLYGYTRHIGNFDECINVAAVLPAEDSRETEERVTGKYCFVDIGYRRKDMPPTTVGPFTFDFNATDSAWEAIREKGDPRRLARYNLRMALCVPSVCSAEDVETMLKVPLGRYAAERNMIVRTSVRAKFCQALNDGPVFSIYGKAFCSLIATLFALVLVATWCDGDSSNDAERTKDGRPVLFDILMCFSARRNLKSFLTTRIYHSGLDSLHVIRFFYTCLVVFGHRAMENYCNPVVNTDYAERIYGFWPSMLLFNGPIVTDGFLALGGLLLAYCLLEELEKSRRINIIHLIFVRFMRYTPSYLLMVTFYATILPHLGSGPYWKAIVGLESHYCSLNSWTNLLYVNNYVKNDEYCMFQTWYLAVDFHMFIISIFLIYAFWHCPRYLGYIVLGLITLVSCMIPTYITYAQRLPPTFIAYLGTEDLRSHHYFINYYVKTHMRASGYLVGVIAGAVIHDHRNSNWKLPKVYSHIAFIVFVVILSLLSVLLAFRYFDPRCNAGPWETAIYAGFHRAAFALSVVSIAILLTIGSGLGFHTKFFTPMWIQPLSKLTYGVFLVHNVLQLYHIGVARSARAYTFHNMVWNFLSDIPLCFFLSFLLELGMEGPLKQLKKRLLTGNYREIIREEQHGSVQKKTN